MKFNLTKAVLEYQKSGENWPEILEQICLIAYQFPRSNTSWDYDRCCEFFISFMPKVPGLVKRFTPSSTFEVYLYISLKMYIRSFLDQLVEQEHYDNWTEEVSIMGMDLLAENNPHQLGDFIPKTIQPASSGPYKVDEHGRLVHKSHRSRILFSVLLHAVDIKSEWIDSLAGLIDCEAQWLNEILEQARNQVKNKTEYRHKVRMQRNEFWYKMKLTQKKMIFHGEWDEEAYRILQRKYHHWKKRYTQSCHSLQRISVRLSQQEISQILQVPMGTVASGLYFMRKTWSDIGE
ncbi:MAG: hypothetical protein B0D92_06115 [Spirochaeta sp. LUC14_002_19_P3]|nr:MAG: hypothetical protein B0D92_06115 [Spirochaeta sp. LUC14_002_19_P3]